MIRNLPDLEAQGNYKVLEDAAAGKIPRHFEVAELAKSLFVVLNSRPKSGDFGYIFEFYFNA